MTTYTVEIQHDDDGELNVIVKDVGSSQKDRSSIAWALREAARMIEDGMPLHKELFS